MSGGRHRRRRHPGHVYGPGPPVRCDTPERGQRCAAEATERMRELAGDTVRLGDGPRLTDTYDRTLAYVYTVDGISIDAAPIREGLGTAWMRDG